MTSWTRRGLLASGALSAVLALAAPLMSAAQSPYAGTTIRFLTSSNASQDAFAAKLQKIGESWDMTVEIRRVTTDELQKKVVLDYVAGADTWDLIYSGGVQRTIEWFDKGIFVDLAPLIAEHGDAELLQWDDITASGRGAVVLDDKVTGIPMATSDQAMAYRTDWFANADEQAAFKERYGYDLAPPDTYDQYRDVAEFFTRKAGDTVAGEKLANDIYGIVNSNKKGTYLWHDYENQLMAFGGQTCHPETMTAGLTDPESIAAAEYYQSLLPFWPPDHINMTSGEAAALFATGRVAVNIEYYDRLVYTMAKGEGSIGPEVVGYTYPPSQENPRGLKHPYRAGPAVISIYSLSDNQEAAYKLLEAATSTQAQIEMTRETPGFMPARTSVLEALKDEMPELQYLIDVANGGADALSDMQEMPYPCILASSDIGDAVSDAISAILIGGDVNEELGKAQAKVQRALDSVAASLK